MAAAAKADGHEKVIAAAEQIVKNLATSKNAADDMIRILSVFDGRFSSIHNDLVFSSSSGGGGVGVDVEVPGEGAGAPSSEAELRLVEAERIVSRWDASDALLWDAAGSPVADVVAAGEYLSAVDEIVYVLVAAEAGRNEQLAGRADTALQMAMSRLEEEFRNLMARNVVPLDSNGLYCTIRRLSLSLTSDSGDAIEDLEGSVVDDEHQQQLQRPQLENSPEERSGSSLIDDRNIDLIHPDTAVSLKAIADRMICAKYERELRQVYCSARRDALDECLCILGVDRMSIEEVQRAEWRMLDEKMKMWIQAVKIVVRILVGEKRLCEHIIAASEELQEECFLETAKGCIMQLLNFADAIAICQRSSEKLFRILDMYEALAEVLPDLQALFSGEAKDLICEEAGGSLKRLGDAIMGTLLDFENAIQKEASRKPMLAGEIHPLTRYVMNYIRLLVVYNDSLDVLLDDSGTNDKDHCSPHDGKSDSGNNHQSMTPLGRRLLLLISYLESNLEEKAKVYDDGAMQYIFLMNNILYIVQKVKDSELGKLLGDDWIRRRRGRVRQYATSYLRVSWTNVLSYLKDNGFGSGSGGSRGVSKLAIKERFKSFNLLFDEIYRVQTGWKVPDPQLRAELRISISEKVIPAYRSFVGRFGSQLEGRHGAKYMKYTAEDLETRLSDLFEGSPGLTSHPRRKT